jgi:exonuclease SbcD
LGDLVDGWVQEADQELPLLLTAHCSIQGAQYGHERTVMLGNDLVLPGSFVRDPRLDYVALGHIHKHQNLNEGAHPPVIYPGSIERVDFGEAEDDKFFVIAHVERGHTEVEWRQLKNIRPFLTSYVSIEQQEGITDKTLSALPSREALEGAIFRLILDYPRDWEALIDEGAIREYTGGCFEFHLVKRPKVETRVRIPQNQNVGRMSPLELLDIYWRASHTGPEEVDSLNKLAAEVIRDVGGESGEQF